MPLGCIVYTSLETDTSEMAPMPDTCRASWPTTFRPSVSDGVLEVYSGGSSHYESIGRVSSHGTDDGFAKRFSGSGPKKELGSMRCRETVRRV